MQYSTRSRFKTITTFLFAKRDISGLFLTLKNKHVKLATYFPKRTTKMGHMLRVVKFIYSEKATKFCEISTLLLSVCTVDKSKVDISGLLRIYEL